MRLVTLAEIASKELITIMIEKHGNLQNNKNSNDSLCSSQILVFETSVSKCEKSKTLILSGAFLVFK